MPKQQQQKTMIFFPQVAIDSLTKQLESAMAETTAKVGGKLTTVMWPTTPLVVRRLIYIYTCIHVYMCPGQRGCRATKQAHRNQTKPKACNRSRGMWPSFAHLRNEWPQIHGTHTHTHTHTHDTHTPATAPTTKPQTASQVQGNPSQIPRNRYIIMSFCTSCVWRRLRHSQHVVLLRMPTSPPRRLPRSNARPGDA